jgi:hypothetical protein
LNESLPFSDFSKSVRPSTLGLREIISSAKTAKVSPLLKLRVPLREGFIVEFFCDSVTLAADPIFEQVDGVCKRLKLSTPDDSLNTSPSLCWRLIELG